MSALYGDKHKGLVAWLRDEWWSAGPTICCLEGFPGVGKTQIRLSLADQLRSNGMPAVSIDVPEPGIAQFDDFLLSVAQALADEGNDALAKAIDEGDDAQGLISRLANTLREPWLIVVDEFQNALEISSGEPTPPFRKLLRTIENRGHLPGRLLLLTDRSPHQGVWSERLTIRRVEGLAVPDGVSFLTALLREQKREAEVAADRLVDIVNWVGGNPRALRSVVAALRYEPLDELIGIQPESWEIREREISAELLRELESQLLAHVLARLEVSDQELLFSFTVFRKAFPTEAIRHFVTADAVANTARARLVDNFLLRHDRGWYALEKVAREVGAGFLERTSQKLKRAHSIAGDFYARHFRSRRIVGGGRLGGDFVEARFHLVQAGRQDELQEIVSAFEQHIRTEITSSAPVPADPRELDERIAVLSALLGNEGAKGLEYHLARCLSTRGRAADAERALTHVRRALGPQAPADTWVLAGRLASQVEGCDSATAILRQGLSVLQASDSLSTLYQSCAELIAREKRTGEAIEMLREGITKVPPRFNLFSLYQSCAELMAREKRTEEALELLREGITKVPSQFNLFSLYQSCAELMAREKRAPEAIDLLREGITKVPPQFNLFSLYQLSAELMAREKRTGEAIELLREGIRKVPPQFGGYRLVEAVLYLTAAVGNVDLMRALVSGRGGVSWAPEQTALGKVLLLQSAGDWASAAEEARRGRDQRPTYISLCLMEAFSWLAAGRADEAQSALDRFQAIRHEKNNPATWLASFIALRLGRHDVAQQLYSQYVGEGEQPPEVLSEDDLLRHWNSPVPISTHHPAYYWSTLPPSLTGLDHPVRRSPPFESSPEIGAAIRESAPGKIAVTHHEIGRQEAGWGAATPDDKSDLRVLALASEWRSRHGGLSTFNRALCAALAKAGAQVVCAVPYADATEFAEAKEVSVGLSLAPPDPGTDEFSGLCRRLNLPNDFVPNIVIGHGHITGSAAQAQVTDFYQAAQRIHFVHAASGEIEFYKGKDDAAAAAEKRERMEVSLAKDASLVVAVGPRLAREAGNFLAPVVPGPPLHRLDPPCAASPDRTPPPAIHCLVLGRAEDFELKGLDIAASAMGRVVSSGTTFEHPPELVVRGAPAGTGTALRERLQQVAACDLAVRVREYTDEAEAIESDLLRSSVLLMPSRREGFGLVAFEALGLGIPILVSDKSGAGELLRERLGASEAQNFVVPTADDLQTAAAAWAKAIEFVLRDLRAAFSRAAASSRALADKHSWGLAAVELIKAIERARQPRIGIRSPG